jgi:hypothetical protein
MEPGPGGSSTISLRDATDATRVLISAGDESGTNAQPNNVAFFSRDGRPISGIGTGPQGQYVVLGDQDGDVRLLLNVDGAGRPSIRMMGEGGQVIWSAP